MTKLGQYTHKEIEAKWQKYWEENRIYAFDKDDTKKPIHIQDTPPPFTSGTLHMGHALNHSWIDFVARYKRMHGYNVLLPQGFDCHGLPTELRVEAEYKIKKEDRENFRRCCVEWTKKCISQMKRQFQRLGYSADWDYEYQTMSDEYKARVQYSLLEFYRKGMVYRKEHPTHWCTNCGTVIAKAELSYEETHGHLHHLKFDVSGGKTITIATTRPEMTPACAAIFVHPDDARYKSLVGKKAKVPLFEREVPIVADKEVDSSFGTGAVYLCTYGDEQDIVWRIRYSLPERIVIDENGKMTEAAGKYKGLTTKECRKQILEDLKAAGSLVKIEPLVHNVLVHSERSSCKQPIEFLPMHQWFIKTRGSSDKVIAGAKEMKWNPDYMLRRLTDWATSLDWDWVISRQRVFGTPIPFWYCDCGEVVPAEEKSLPIDPMKDKPPVGKCPKCGAKELHGVREVCDCWVDSSISALVASQWRKDDKLFKRLYPTSLRPQGYEIIRTWLFYTTFRCLELTGKIPFKEVMINGMVQGEDGRKMSKSLGNMVPPDETMDKFGADALRQWAAYAMPGADVAYNWKDITYAHKFSTKLWNLCRFAQSHLESYKPTEVELTLTDRAMLSKLSKVMAQTEAAWQKCEFFNVLTPVQQFIWHDLCDNYLEMVKHRLYNAEPSGRASREAAQHTLYTVLETCLKLLAPMMPHITEELYQNIMLKPEKSIHRTTWPAPGAADDGAEEAYELAVKVLGHLRKWKSDHGMAMNAELASVDVFGSAGLAKVKDDIAATMKVKELKLTGSEKGLEKVEDGLFVGVRQ